MSYYKPPLGGGAGGGGGGGITVLSGQYQISGVYQLSGAAGAGSSGSSFVGGVAVFSGNGSGTTYVITHSIGTTPTKFTAIPNSLDAMGDYRVESSGNTLSVIYTTARPSGASNISLGWMADTNVLSGNVSLGNNILVGGTAMFSGNTSGTTFLINHNIGVVPSRYGVVPSTVDAVGDYRVEASGNTLSVIYTAARASGASNIGLVWFADTNNVSGGPADPLNVGTLNVSGNATFSGQVVIAGPIIYNNSGISFSGMQMMPGMTDAQYIVWSSGSTTRTLRVADGQIVYSGTNSTSGIMKALSSLTSGRTNKEKVTILGYHEVTKLRFPSYIKIDANGGRVFQISGTNTNMIENLDNSGATGNLEIEIEGGVWDGNRAGQTGGGGGDTTSMVWFGNCSDINIHDGYWLHANYHNFRFLNCLTDIRITNNRIENWKQEGVCDQAPHLAYGVAHHHIVADNYFAQTPDGSYSNVVGSCAVSTVNVSDFMFSNNEVNGINAGSMTTFNGIRSLVIGNVITNGAGGSGVYGSGAVSAGIVLAQGTSGTFDSSYSIIANNIIRNLGAAGIHVQNGWPSRDITIIGNQVDSVYGTTANGIVTQDSANIKIIGNTVSECTAAGISINGNFISGSTVLSGSRDCMVQNNLCYNNGNALNASVFRRAGISVQSTNSGLMDNMLVQNNRCYDNRISGGQLHGIHVQGTTNCVVTNNNVRGNFSSGILLTAPNVNPIIKYNAGYTTENRGQFLGSGNAATTVYTIAHGLSASPVSGLMSVIPGSPLARGDFDVSGDATNIYVSYPVAPASGNVKLFWSAEV